MQYIIEGGQKLKGEIKVSGNKNSVFPCLAAALLTEEEVILENVPSISDTFVMISILKKIGVNIQRKGDTLYIKSPRQLESNLPEDLSGNLRGSIVLVGAILARNKKVKFSHPGGDIIGRRSIEAHLKGFEALGAKIIQDDLKYSVQLTKKSKDCYIFQVITSVTGTENLILASVLYPGVVTIRNCASDPHVIDLCKMLISMGAKINGVGGNLLIIEGVKQLKGIRFRLSVDHLEVGSFAIAAAITQGEVMINGVEDADLDPVLVPLVEFGMKYSKNDHQVIFSADQLKAVPKLITNTWPGFPTDMMSPAIVLATQSQGVTLCHDTIYESRMFFVDKLISMGANITIADPHRVLVYGFSKLHGRNLETPDIRAGMALVLASLKAEGESIINRAELIERGYEDVVGKLSSLGARIKRLSNKGNK